MCPDEEENLRHDDGRVPEHMVQLGLQGEAGEEQQETQGDGQEPEQEIDQCQQQGAGDAGLALRAGVEGRVVISIGQVVGDIREAEAEQAAPIAQAGE